jgi:hypothetical protein
MAIHTASTLQNCNVGRTLEFPLHLATVSNNITVIRLTLKTERNPYNTADLLALWFDRQKTTRQVAFCLNPTV